MKKNWIVINGSPRKGKNSDKIVDGFESLFNDRAEEFIKYKISDLEIAPCKGCYSCMSDGICDIQDDFQKIIDDIRDSKKMILISPSYNYNVTAQMKSFIDRLFSQFKFSGGKFSSRLGDSIDAIIIGLCAGDTENNLGFTLDAMRRPLNDLGIKILGEYKYLNTRKNPIMNYKDIEESLRNFIDENEIF